MKLTEEQIAILKQNLSNKEQELLMLNKDSHNIYDKKIALKNEMKAIANELKIATTDSEETIGLCSRFRATINFSESGETNDYLISDSNVKIPGFIIISTKSPLAKAVMGLKEQDKFSYDVVAHMYYGVIEEIYNENVKESPKTMKLEK